MGRRKCIPCYPANIWPCISYAPGTPHTMDLNLDCELALSILLDAAIVGGRVSVLMCVPGDAPPIIIWQTRANSQTPPSVTLPRMLTPHPPHHHPCNVKYNLISRVLQGPGFFPCSTFESFLPGECVQTTLLNLLLQLLETKSGFKTNRILPLYSQELHFKIKHKVGKCTNNQQMSQLRYHCMPLRQPIRCTYTFHVTDFRCTYFVH